MGKYKKSPREYNSQSNNEKCDRPVDNDIELKFMSKIRGAKVQLINTQSQLEIQLFLNNMKKKNKKNKKRTEQDHLNRQTRDKLQEIIVQKFKEINIQKKLLIVKKYNQLRESFKFLQIKELTHLPKYLFDDGNDLSYILHQINIAKIKRLEEPNPTPATLKEASPFKPEQLFLFGLLCLNDRNQLSINFINKVLDKFTLVTRLIKYGLSLIHQQLKQKLKKGQPLTFYEQNYSEYSQEDEMQQGEQQEDDQDEDEDEDESSSFANNLKEVSSGRTKKIFKQQKQSLSSSCRGQSKERIKIKAKSDKIVLTQDEKINRVIQKLVNYIVWSYKYVFDEELKLRIKGQRTRQSIAVKYGILEELQVSFNFK